MHKLFFKHLVILLLIFVVTRLYRIGIQDNLIVYGISFVNAVVLYLITVKKVPRLTPFWTPIIYTLSPWTLYLENLKSIYLLVTLIFVMTFYLSLYRKTLIYFNVAVVLVTIIFFNKELFYSDIGIINAANVFRGEALLEGLGLISKLIESKYVLYAVTLVTKTLAVADPLIYFSGQAKEIPFFTYPPVWLGLLPIFAIGFWKILGKVDKIWFLVLGLLPGILSVKYYDFEKLFLFTPFIFLVTAIGVKNTPKAFVLVCFLLVCLQIFMFALSQGQQLWG